MSKTAIIIAILFPIAAFATVPVLAPSTHQPSADGAGASNQSGSTAAPGAASDRSDPSTGPTSGPETSKR
jgi:hypothetical protein